MIYSGKTLGGGSSINGAAWTRGLAAQYDAWSQLLETSEASLNWNWDNLFGYMKKVGNNTTHLSFVNMISLTFGFTKRRKHGLVPMTNSGPKAQMESTRIMDQAAPFKSRFQTPCTVAHNKVILSSRSKT
jgi:choline dehydrogenase-like flavoprotein